MHSLNTLRRPLGLAIAVMIAATALNACSRPNSRVNWQNPDVPRDEWSLDMGECRRYARREVERAAGPAATAAPSDNLGGGIGTYNRSMSNYDLARLEERSFSACMRTKGYTPISGS